MFFISPHHSIQQHMLLALQALLWCLGKVSPRCAEASKDLTSDIVRITFLFFCALLLGRVVSLAPCLKQTNFYRVGVLE